MILITIPICSYNALLARCDTSRPEYEILVNGFIERSADGSREIRIAVDHQARELLAKFVEEVCAGAVLHVIDERVYSPTTLAQLKSNSGIKLRDHPLMSYRGIPNWPPVWTAEFGNRRSGEVGVLKNVKMTHVFKNKVFLTMICDGSRYMGCLIFDDVGFCRQIFSVLERNLGKRIKEIGDLDLAHTF